MAIFASITLAFEAAAAFIASSAIATQIITPTLGSRGEYVASDVSKAEDVA